MLARFFAVGFLLAELLALAFFVGAEGSVVSADPAYDDHQLFQQCAAVGGATDCGSVCFYANCERERCRQVCRTRRTCESRDADGKCESWDRERVCREVCTTHYYRCRFHTMRDSNPSRDCDGTASVDCDTRYDCAQCQEWEWYIYDGTGDEGNKNDRGV